MGNTSSITIEVNDKGALQAFKGINAEAGKLGPTLQPIQHISEQTFNNIEGGALRAREAAALVGEEFGVKIPRALRGVLAQSSLIGPALSTAFSGLALIGFIDIAERAGEVIASYVDKLVGWSEFAKKTMDAQTALNKEITDSIDKIEKLDKAYRLIGLEGVAAFAEKQKMANEDLDGAKKKVADLTAEMVKLGIVAQQTQSQVTITGTSAVTSIVPTEGARKASERLQAVTNELAAAQQQLKELGVETRNVDKEFSSAFSKEKADAIREVLAGSLEAINKMRTMQSEANKKGLTPEALVNVALREQYDALQHYLELYSDMPGVVEQAQKTSEAIEAAAAIEREKIYQTEFDKANDVVMAGLDKDAELRQRHAEKIRRMDDETFSAERAAAVAMAAPWDRANVSIVASYQERMDRIKAALATGDLDEAHAARQTAAVWNEAFGQMRDNLASQMQGIFDDITSGNIGKRFKKMFEDLVFQMVATWILGMNGMRSASAGAMGGGSGGILGALFGLGGGGSGPGGTPPFLGGLFGGSGGGGGDALGGLPAFSGGSEASGAFSLFGLGLSSGQGGGTPGGVLPSGAATGGAAAGLGGLLTKIFPHGLKVGGMTLSGSMLATAGLAIGVNGIQRGGVLGALEGAAGGALTGFAVGGPIGALIGGAIGLFSSILGGLFGEHTGDKARKAVMEPLGGQIKLVRDSYDVFQTDYNSAVSELEQLKASSLTTLKQIGGKQVKGNSAMVGVMIGDAETYLKNTEAERARRGQINFGPAQFHEGGLVRAGFPAVAGRPSFHWGGEVNANLLTGEGVLNRSAMSRIGEAGLNRMNAGGSGGDVHVHVHTIDGPSTEKWLRAGGLRVIVGEIHRAQRHGGF